MTPNELADYLDNNVEAMLHTEQKYIDQAAILLRQFDLAESIIKQKEIEIRGLTELLREAREK